MRLLVGKNFITDTEKPSCAWLQKYIHPDDQAYVLKVIHDAIRERKTFELEHRVFRQDGSLGWTHSCAIPILDEQGGISEWVGMARDVTESKRIAIELANREAKYRAVIETAADGFLIVDDEGRILETNDAYAQRSGYSRDELLTKRLSDLDAQETTRQINEYIKKVRAKTTDRFVKWHRTKSGEVWPVEISTSYWQTPAGGRFFAFLHDITDQLRIEKEAQGRRGDMEALLKQQVAAQTASAIAHELNQPLVAVSAYSEVALEMLSGNKEHSEKLASILKKNVEQAQRAGRTLHELLNLLHKADAELSAIDINDMVVKALATVKENGHEGFQTVLELAPNLPPALGNRLQIQKVIINLIQNGVEAMRDAGVANAVITVRSVAANNKVQVTVSDTGPGVNGDKIPHLFEPFFTTKPKGVGLGLAISRAMVEAHGGQFWFDPEAGPGATFHFTLPLAD